MLNLKNNKNDAVFDEICKKKKRRLKIISKNQWYFFGQHPLVEKSPTVTAQGKCQRSSPHWIVNWPGLLILAIGLVSREGKNI